MQAMQRRSFLATIPAFMAVASAQDPQPPRRPKVPGTLALRARRRAKDNAVAEQTLSWPVARTAIVICDMWDTHTCSMSAQRVAALAPRMNHVVSAARANGVMIIHAPSDVTSFYDG